MSDLISRKQAIEAIPQTSVDVFENCRYCNLLDREQVIYIIKSLPSADRPTWECKDCTYWDKLDYDAPRHGWCNQFEEWTDADEFCSRCAKMKGGTE